MGATRGHACPLQQTSLLFVLMVIMVKGSAALQADCAVAAAGSSGLLAVSG